MKMQRVLPIERQVLRARGAAQDLADLARELLSSHRLPSDPRLLMDIIHQGAQRLTQRIPGICLMVWRRDSAGTELCYRTDAPQEAESLPAELPEAAWDGVFADPQGSQRIVLPSPEAAPLFDNLARLGHRMICLHAWGRPEGLHGVVLGGGLNKEADESERICQAIEVLASYFTSVTDIAGSLWDLYQTRQRLEGGLSAMHQVASAITAHPDHPVDTLSAIVSIIAKALEADLCAFLLYDDKAGELVTQVGAYGLSGDEGSLYRLPITNDKSSSIRVFLTGMPFVTGDAQSDPRVISRYAKLWRCHSLIVVPLSLRDRRIGVMRVGSFKKDYFTSDHLQLLQLIAEEAVVLVESALLTRKLAEANQKLSEINKLKDEFVSTASHEFKTPLTTVKGFLTVLLQGEAGPLTEQQRRFLKISQSATDRLTALVSDLLDLSRLEAGVSMDFVPVSLAQLAEECRHDHEPQARARAVHMEVSCPPSLPQVRGDAKWLRQLLDNLISNALKFTPAGGTVAILGEEMGDVVRVTVKDTGVGINAEDQQRIFDKFYRANNRDLTNPPGTGLGLAIVKFIIDKHEGRVWVDSEPGKGSNFHFILPLAKKGEAVEEVV
ncbi:MAG: GAF domain-containing sensor histidine kinase [Elusimicrobia bacterium]|nr:GAF domain-containing sensor histidine kinase [Elusimicrobiota bacterium]